MTYAEFLARKHIADVPTGFEPGPLPGKLFAWQADIARWGCRRGRAALFEDCGLGKTPQQLAIAQQIVDHTGGNVLILAPLGVVAQHVREGQKFGIAVHRVRDQSEVQPGINVSNYERLHLFDLSRFVALILDESSILKSFDGATRTAIIEKSARTEYKLACTATAAPNDYMELGNHAEYLGVMTGSEMFSTFFVHDGGETSQWRLKGHAEKEFWRWVCSWAINIRKPSDLGYDDGAFTLPPLRMHEHIVDGNQKMDGYLFALPASTLAERRLARKATLGERSRLAADMATSDRDQWLLWCNLNAEADELERLTGFSQIAGCTPEADREKIALAFLDGSIRGVITKPSIWGYGMNLQCCHKAAAVGISDSYEDFYQVIRRIWRFGQTSPVDFHIIISRLEGAVLANIKRKEANAMRMATEMVRNMADISSAEIKGITRDITPYHPTTAMAIPQWL